MIVHGRNDCLAFFRGRTLRILRPELGGSWGPWWHASANQHPATKRIWAGRAQGFPTLGFGDPAPWNVGDVENPEGGPVVLETPPLPRPPDCREAVSRATLESGHGKTQEPHASPNAALLEDEERRHGLSSRWCAPCASAQELVPAALSVVLPRRREGTANRGEAGAPPHADCGPEVPITPGGDGSRLKVRTLRRVPLFRGSTGGVRRQIVSRRAG